MQSIAYVPGSNGAGNASLMTVQNVRASGASDILVNTVTGAPNKFYATMGAPHTFTDPVTGETITLVSEATAVDFAGHIDTGKIVIDAIAPGYVDTRGSLVGDVVVIRPITEWANNLFNILSQAHNDDGSIKNAAVIYNANVGDHVQSGGVLAIVSALNGSMSALVGYQAGNRNTIAAVASRAYTASKDTYVDVLRNTTTNVFTLVYTEVANAAAAPALAANSFRLGKVVTSGVAITSILQFGRDSLGNTIYPDAPISGAELNASDLSANMKVAYNTSVINPGGTSTSDFWASGHGLGVSFNVTKRCKALVHVTIAASSTTDFEFHPIIYLDNVDIKRLTPVAAPGFGGNRATERSVEWVVELSPGTHIISGGAFFSSGTSISIPGNAAFVSAVVLGKVAV